MIVSTQETTQSSLQNVQEQIRQSRGRDNNGHDAVAEKYLTFRLGNESYGIAVLQIREIIRMQKITLVPQMPNYVKGVINLRGKVIPVIDMRLRFGVGNETMTERTCIVVVQIQNTQKEQSLVGLIVDAVEEVINISQSQIENKPELGTQLDNQYILGIAKIRSEVKTLLNIEKVILEASNIQLPQTAHS